MHKILNKKKIFIVVLVLIVSASLSFFFSNKFQKNYSIVKVNEYETKKEDKVSDKILNYLKSKNINTDPESDTLKQIYWVERIDFNQ